MITYKLTNSGYELYYNNRLWVECPYDPDKSGFNPFESDEAKISHIMTNYPEAAPK